ncbi:hypothetical protein RUND412_006935 [Rhizina undulata]
MTDYRALFPDDDDDQQINSGHPFVIPNLWQPSCLAPDLSQASPLFPIIPLQETNRRIEFPKNVLEEPGNTIFALPAGFSAHIPSFTTIWPQNDQPAESHPASSYNAEDMVFSSVDSEDIWMNPESTEPPPKPRFQTWDSFLVCGANDPTNPYLSEAGSKIFDSVLEWNENGSGDVIRTDVFCTCLLYLGLGRSSVLFTYDRQGNKFRPVRDDLRISGCTTGSVESIAKAFASCGNNIRKLQRFAENVYKNSTSVKPTLVALAECTTAVVESIEQRLSISPASIKSILDLHSLIREPALIVDTFEQIISKTTGSENDSQLLSSLFDVVQQLQHRIGWLKPLLSETLAKVSRPWLEFVEEWIGLDKPVGGEGIGFEGLTGREIFVKVDEESEVDERGKEKHQKVYVFDKKMIPSFMSMEVAETVFESGKSLRFLQKFHPNHPLSKPGAVSGVPKLEWKFSWEDLDNLQSQAKTYEKNLRVAIEKYTKNTPIPNSESELMIQLPESPDPFEFIGKSKEEIAANLGKSVSAMNESLPSLTSSNDNSLRNLVLIISRFRQNTTDDEDHLTTFAPPLSITPMMSFSHIFSVQSKMINTACLRMFFKEHKIRDHLSILRKFQLFGDGVFSSRLSHALFDDEVDTTERQVGKQRTGGAMGLKLGSRDTWPPASSELRLALMGVLIESFAKDPEEESHIGGIYHAGKEGELPGGLSFAVREMTQEELDKCMNPHGIEALDFLKLQYKPPAPLDAIITSTALYRYDRLFKLLLRVLRMQFVVGKLFKDITSRDSLWKNPNDIARKFRTEAQHFVGTVCGYMFESGVSTAWRGFEGKLAEIEARLDSNQGLEEEGIERLRAYHESILDRIMFATLSRKRQAPVMNILEEIFVCILSFAKVSHAKAGGRMVGREGDREVADLYKTFRRKVGIFISVCRGLSEKRGYGDGRKDLEGRRAVDAIFGTGYREEGNLLGNLLLRLEMTGYYSESAANLNRGR